MNYGNESAIDLTSVIRYQHQPGDRILRPTLCIQTVQFDQSDIEAALNLGTEVYALLTRPLEQPLARGANIPVLSGVQCDAVELEAAEQVLLIPVLGKTSFNIKRNKIIEQLDCWNEQLGSGHILILATGEAWRNVEGELPGKVIFPDSGTGPAPNQVILNEILRASICLLESPETQRSFFVSYTRTDLDSTAAAVTRLRHHLETGTSGESFFDSVRFLTGESLAKQVEVATRSGVFCVLRGDTFSSRDWCQRELLRAKRDGFPTLVLEILQTGEQRSSPYAGNSATIVWNDDPAAIVTRAMVELLCATHFRLEGQRLIKSANLPGDTLVLTRHPELLDLAQGPLLRNQAQLVLHPDPELPVVEQQIMKSVQPRLNLVTPTTLYRKLLAREGQVMEAPLEGMQVAMSFSKSPDSEGPEGFTSEHIKDASVFLARTLISAGATIAYGGDFRRDPDNYTTLLGELIARYNNSTAEYKDYLNSYLAAPIDLEFAPADIPLTIHRVHAEDEFPESIMPGGPYDKGHAAALYFSDMRKVMANRTTANIVMAGQSHPRLVENGIGYGGRYPGVVEEAWRSIQVGHPLYVIGGFGGAASLVAELLEGNPIPEDLDDEKWLKHGYFKANADSIDGDPFREQLGLPSSMKELAETIRSLGTPLLESDESSIAWNGLTYAENQTLFRNRDPITLSWLIFKGLSAIARKTTHERLLVELTPGSIVNGCDLDMISVATFDNMPLGGAAASIDQIISGRARLERSEGKTLVSLADTNLDADWLHLASLGPLGQVDELEASIRKAAEKTAITAERHGLRRIGVVAYGGAIVDDIQKVANAMISGFASIAGNTTIAWFESNARRLVELKTLLHKRDDIQLSVRPEKNVQPVDSSRSPATQLILQVTSEKDLLKVTVVPPAGTGIAFSHQVKFGEQQLANLTMGGGSDKRSAPDFDLISSRGEKIAELLFDKDAQEIIGRCQGAKIVVVHDFASSGIPFEMLAANLPDPPSTRSGMCRRLAVDWAPVDTLFARPAKAGKFNVLLVVNPTGDLPGASREGQAIREILQQNSRIELTILEADEATSEKVLEALPGADVLHYAGHAFFDGPAEHESGLVLSGRKTLTTQQLRNVKMPRIAIVNACEAGRVRGAAFSRPKPVESGSASAASCGSQAASFAGLFLRSGIEAYVGTFWKVDDAGATLFAKSVYTQLAMGKTIEAAVTDARRSLLEIKHADWSNYLLYGEGDFSLVNE